MRSPLFVGKICYVLGYPFIRLWLWHSKRVYVVIMVDDEILVTKNWLGLHERWRLPGGGAHDDETDQSALLREVREELGISIEDYSLQRLTPKPVHSRKGYVYSLFALKLPNKPTLTINESEIVAAQWICNEKMDNTPICSELKHALLLLARPENVL